MLNAYTVVGVLPCSHLDAIRSKGFSYLGMTGGIIRSCRLFDKPWLCGREVLHVIDGLVYIPALCNNQLRASSGHSRFASTMRTQPVGPADLPWMALGSTCHPSGMFAGSSMIFRTI